MFRKCLCPLLIIVFFSQLAFSSTVSFTKEGRFFSDLSNNSTVSYTSDYANGLVLGGGILNPVSSVTYSFAIPNPQISASVFLSGMEIEIFGKSNGGITGSSGVDVMAGTPQNNWSIVLPDAETSTSHVFSSPSSFLRSSGDGVTWYLDVTFSAVENLDYYDLKYVKITFEYTGLSDGDFLRLSHITNGISALNGLKQFHNEYFEVSPGSCNIVQKAIGSAYEGTRFDALMGAIALGLPI